MFESGAVLQVTLALIALASLLLVPWLNNRNQRANKVEDWARQDAVAAKAEAAAKQAQTDAAKILAVTATTVEKTTILGSKVDVLHKIANSALTAALTGELHSTKRELVLLLEKTDPSPEVLEIIIATRSRIGELQTRIDALNKLQEQLDKDAGAQLLASVAPIPTEIVVEHLAVSADVATVSTPKMPFKEKFT